MTSRASWCPYCTECSVSIAYLLNKYKDRVVVASANVAIQLALGAVPVADDLLRVSVSLCLRLLPHLLLRFLRRASHRAGVVRALPFLRSRRGALPSPRRLQQIVLLAHSPRLLGLAAAAAERVEHVTRGWLGVRTSRRGRSGTCRAMCRASAKWSARRQEEVSWRSRNQ